jgi:hypothetical protein
MAKKANPTTEDLLAQFQKLIDSSVPDEYKQVLHDFKNQGEFYTQLLQGINTDHEALESFWQLPESFGVSAPWLQNNDAFGSFFDINQHAKNSKENLSQQFTETLNRFSQKSQQHMSGFQQSLNEMGVLHNGLNQNALTRFNALREKTKDTSPDTLCKLWLQAGEEAYKETSQQADYIKTQRTLFESLGALKDTQKGFTDQYVQLMGLPQQQEIDALKSGLHALRLEFAEYKEQTATLIHSLSKSEAKKPVKKSRKKSSARPSKG